MEENPTTQETPLPQQPPGEQPAGEELPAEVTVSSGEAPLQETDGDCFPRAGEGGDPAALREESDQPTDTFSLSSVVESILFTSQKPVAAKEILQILRGAAGASPDDAALQILGKTKESALREAIESLRESCHSTGRCFEIRESAAGWQLVTSPRFAPWLRQLFPENRPARLSAPALETLAIIAYRQPITRADIEAVRGVSVDGVMQTLLDRGLVKIAGRAEVPGRPLLYATTEHFMEHFGLRDLDDLPNSSELRHVPLPAAREPSAPDTPENKEPAPEAPQNEDVTASTVAETESAASPGSPGGQDEAVASTPAMEESLPDPVLEEPANESRHE